MRKRRLVNGADEFYIKRRQRLKPWFDYLKIGKLLEGGTNACQRALLQSKWPDPEIVFPNAPEWWPAVYKRILENWKSARVRILANEEKELPAWDAVTIFGGAVCWLVKEWSKEKMDGVGQYSEPLSIVAGDVLERAMNLIELIMLQELYGIARIDGPLIHLRTELPPMGTSKPLFVWHLSLIEPQQEKYDLTRGDTIFRLIDPISVNGERWGCCTPRKLGFATEGSEMPVFIHSHALRRLLERLRFWPKNCDRLDWAALEGIMEKEIIESLKDPRTTAGSNGARLVEYRHGDFKIGHLVVVLRDETVVIQTFLLCGMKGTPEAEKLYEQLRITRRDFEWTGLDTFNQWLTSDLRADPQLRAILEDCGFGDLFALSESVWSDPISGCADSLRKFVGTSRLRMAHSRLRSPMKGG